MQCIRFSVPLGVLCDNLSNVLLVDGHTLPLTICLGLCKPQQTALFLLIDVPGGPVWEVPARTMWE